MFRRIERAKRSFMKSQKSGNVWLGEICGIAFWNQQKFAFQERQLPVAISVSRDSQIAIPPNFFAENQIYPLPLRLQSSPFTIYILNPLPQRISFTRIGSLFNVFALLRVSSFFIAIPGNCSPLPIFEFLI